MNKRERLRRHFRSSKNSGTERSEGRTELQKEKDIYFMSTDADFPKEPAAEEEQSAPLDDQHTFICRYCGKVQTITTQQAVATCEVRCSSQGCGQVQVVFRSS
jgi:hypothetical protein